MYDKTYKTLHYFPITNILEVLVKPQHNGTECPSNITETEYCNDKDCPEGKSNKRLFISVDFFTLQRNKHVNKGYNGRHSSSISSN